jgi:hypothetical protein
MNLLQLQQECGRLLNDPNNTRWSKSILTTRLNQAQKEIVSYTNVLKIYGAVAITAGTGATTLDATVMEVQRVYITLTNGDNIPLVGISINELDYRYPNWQNLDSGQPTSYTYDHVTRNLTFIPRPDTDITLNMYHLINPADMSSDSDIPFDSNTPLTPYHISLVHWSVAQCWMDDGTPESLAKAMFHKTGDVSNPGQYELQLKRIMDKFDGSENIQTSVLWKPEGGRLGLWLPSKSYPLGSGWSW